MQDMELLTHIEQKPGVLGGKPVRKGTRISVEVLERLANGASFAQLMRDYDSVEEDIKAALLYARHVLSEKVRGLTLQRKAGESGRDAH